MSELQYALVHDGRVVTENNIPVITGFVAIKPDEYSAKYPDGCKWLPVRDVDSQPFIYGLHYKESPTYQVSGDHVERVYRIMRAFR